MEEKVGVLSQRPVRRPSAVVISQRNWFLIRALAIATSCLCVLLIIALIVVVIIKTTPPYCSSSELVGKGPNLENPGLFNDLTPNEMEAVRDYMLGQDRLGLTPYEDATVNSSYIYMITLQSHLKDTMLKFQTGNHRRPRRAAKVVVYRGDQRPARVEEYLVGPLPQPSYARALWSPAYRRVPIPYTSRPVDTIERKQLKEFLNVITEELQSLFRESYGLSYHNCSRGEGCLIFRDFAPRGTESGQRMSWFWAYRDKDGSYLHPLGFAVQIDHKDPDPSMWVVTRVMYNGQLFYEIEDLAQRYAQGSLRKIVGMMDPVDAQFSSYKRRGHASFDTPLRGPRLVEPDGHRYSIDDQFVKYFGWSFNFHMRTTTGLQILDVYFQGEKIAYELSLQDITAFYTGYTPETSWLALYGVSWLLGASSYELVPGVDCPATASFRDAYHYVNTGKPLRYKNSVCVFEHSSSLPLRRHFSRDTDGKFNSYGGLVSSSLVVRTIISLWSSDYILDYIFHLDGAIELKISLTGYVHASYDLTGQRPYGNRLHDNVRGNLHQHLFHWKVDLDIEQTSNRYQTLDLSTESGSSFWYEGEVNKTQLKFEPVLKEDERDASAPYDFDQPRKHIIYNRKADNRFEAHRAYEIINEAKSKFLLENSAITNAASWARYQIAVTKYKDIEDASSSIYAQGDPYDPVLDFARFLEDNDTIVDTDLIFWLTSGLYHIPHAEDVPSSSSTATQCRVILRPYNFFNHCPSLAVSDALLVKRQADGRLDFDTFGISSEEPRCYQREKEMTGFSGTVDTLS
ncbi:amiloride-sensitive amine oxidase [copper-containing] [Aplysia californica]|uniref:Amine oxidase n=1 Tax=Aplysia californica TaxID=6500 RepID=A0ABM0JVN4_APLCA|nr:amiloride-sensitive amine oxidase [copper-containing] [Aplysia californica]